jgi:peptide/nickel transport system substrate-binding protein
VAGVLRRARWVRAVCALAILGGLVGVAAAAGGGGSDPVPTRGGTLRVGMPQYCGGPFSGCRGRGFDITFAPLFATNVPAPLEVLRCCLLRTLLSYNGQPTGRGGSELRPDLATALPDVSKDGLTWTFHIRPGLRYGPPFDGVEITAQDVIRAVKLAARPGRFPRGVPDVYVLPDALGPIAGLHAYEQGRVGSISGLEAPDRHTLVVRLTRQAGDLGYRFAEPWTAPVPDGAAVGHEADFIDHPISSGPYMVAVYQPGRVLTLVRNPEWRAATDPLRPAYADRIVIRMNGTPDGAAHRVDRGQLDVVLDASAPRWQLVEHRAHPRLRGRLYTDPYDGLTFINLNIAVPPFDDVHVRRAVAFAVDKARLAGLYDRLAQSTLQGVTGVPVGHLIPDGLEGNLLRGWDAYPTPGAHGSLARARAEMRASRYDANGDGRCDRAACAHVVALVHAFPLIPFLRPWSEVVRRELAGVGIHLDLRRVPDRHWVAQAFDLAHRVPIILGNGYGKDFPSASSLFGSFFDGRLRDPRNTLSGVGARPALLKSLGYGVTRVPSINGRIDRCLPLTGLDATRCWAALDKYLMQQVVPWVPVLDPLVAKAVSARVTSFSFDQFAIEPALDRIAVRAGP